MSYDDLVVLIPSHSLEDFPTELDEPDAAGLLNAFAVLWHPVLLAEAGAMPRWERSDDPPEELENRLVIVPSACHDWLPGGWSDHARSKGAVVLDGLADRGEMIRAALEPLAGESHVDPDLAADFLALGTCNLQIELLTRHMHHYSSLDEVLLQREAVAGAKAALAGDAAAARTHLQACFEQLAEARERFYPVDCYLIDLCLLIPELADAHLERALKGRTPVNLLICGAVLEQLGGEKPGMLALIREALAGERADVAGGEFRERPSPLFPLESVLWDFRRGRESYRHLLGRAPSTWGRRRFGLSTQIPQLVSKFGMNAALHIALDDGLYPDAEMSKVRWEGCDGTIIDAITRIPLAAEGAAGYLRFPLRMAESMEEDHVAAVVFARWPEVKAPWFEDFRRVQSYAPALGRFVTLAEFFETTDDPGRMSAWEAREYLSPFFIQAVAREEADPISRFTGHLRRRHAFDAALWCRHVAAALCGEAIDDAQTDVAERLLEDAGPDADEKAVQAAETMLAGFAPQAAKRLAEVVMHSAGERPGYLVLNPLSFPRTAAVELPELSAPPPAGGPVKGVQFDEQHRTVALALPGCGFAWLPLQSAPGDETAARAGSSIPTAEENVLRNEFFEVYLNEETGGIAQIKEYGRRPNRLSEQLAFRFPAERTIVIGEGDDAWETKSWYSAMRCHSSRVTCAGPLLGEIVTEGAIVDQNAGERLAGFRQVFRVWRGRRIVEIDLELDVDRMPAGDPWSNYFAARFAWYDPAATLTRSVQQGAHSFSGERFESPHYIEIANEEGRTTILPLGLPFHRQTGMRMLDSILVAAGESERRFRFVIAVDEDYPMQAALDAMVPPAVVPVRNGPPQTGETGWFFHLTARNVQLTRLLPLLDEPKAETASWEQSGDEKPTNEAEGGGTGSEADDPDGTPGRPAVDADGGVGRPSPSEAGRPAPSEAGSGFAVRLVETEGRHRRCRLTCFRPPASARQRDFTGRTISRLTTEGDAVTVEMTPYEIADIELKFA